MLARNRTEKSYSICMLCSNDGATVRSSVESVAELAKYRKVEVIIVDNMSKDESPEVLRHLRDAHLITLIERRCSRGEGRQLAFKASTGDYILGHMDCDDVFDAEGLDSLLRIYQSRYDGLLLMTQKKGSIEASNITIAPRPLLEDMGGWRKLNEGEDWDLWARASGLNKYVYIPYPMDKPPHRSIKVRYGLYKSPVSRFVMRTRRYSDAIKSGRRMFKGGEQVSVPQKLAYFVAKAGVMLKQDYLAPIPNPDFSEFSTS